MPRQTVQTKQLWVAAIRHRSRTLPQRACVGLAACLLFSPMIGWDVCLTWLGFYLLFQELERQTFKPAVKLGAASLTRLRMVVGHVLVIINVSLYGLLSIPPWLVVGPLGGVAAAVLLMAGMMHAVIMSGGSLRLFISTVLPQWLILGLTPFFMAHQGATSDVIIAASVAICAFGIFCLTARQHLFQAAVSENKARIEADHKRHEAERAMRERSALLAAVAHDLRTPISAIMTGAAQIGLTDNPTLRRQHVSLITDASHMMRALLDDVLDHARLEAGRMTIESQSFDVRLLLSQTVRLWQAPVKAKGLKIRLEGARTLPRYLRGDAMRLRQILNNLISNALKFTNQGSITMRLCSWIDDDEQHVLLIDIADTGHGMSPQQLERLFTPYDQTAEGVAAQFGGSGLGLAISRYLVELMGGRLTVRSSPDRGSIFTLSVTLPEGDRPNLMLPAERPVYQGLNLPPPPLYKPSGEPVSEEAEPSKPDPSEDIHDDPDESPLKILVVDDHDINRRAIQLILHSLNCDVSMAENGHQALKICELRSFDVIFMDVRMPELDGRETTRRLRSGGGINAKVPVIAVTADNAEEDIEACLAAGMNKFVSKPLTPTSLLTALDITLKEAAAASPASAAA